MTALSAIVNKPSVRMFLPAIIAGFGVFMFLRTGVSFNLAMAVGLTLCVLTIWLYNKVNGFIAGVIFFLTKAIG